MFEEFSNLRSLKFEEFSNLRSLMFEEFSNLRSLKCSRVPKSEKSDV